MEAATGLGCFCLPWDVVQGEQMGASAHSSQESSSALLGLVALAVLYGKQEAEFAAASHPWPVGCWRLLCHTANWGNSNAKITATGELSLPLCLEGEQNPFGTPELLSSSWTLKGRNSSDGLLTI